MAILRVSWIITDSDIRGRPCRRLVIRYRWFWMKDYDRIRYILY